MLIQWFRNEIDLTSYVMLARVVPDGIEQSSVSVTHIIVPM